MIKSHQATGKQEGKWVPCKATTRNCPVGDDGHHLYFANMGSMKLYNRLNQDFPEFSDGGGLANVIGKTEGGAHAMHQAGVYSPMGGWRSSGERITSTFSDGRAKDIWKLQDKVAECKTEAALGNDVSKEMDEGSLSEAEQVKSMLWEPRHQGLSSKGAGTKTINTGFADVSLGGKWDRKFMTIDGSKVTRMMVVGNGHTVASIRRCDDRPGHENDGGCEVRLTTKDNPRSSICFTPADGSNSVSLTDDRYGRALDEAVGLVTKDAQEAGARNASITIDERWIGVSYDYGHGTSTQTGDQRFPSMDAFAGKFPKAAEVLKRQDVRFLWKRPSGNRTESGSESRG